MGMTDMQFKAYLRGLIADLERALKISPDNVELKQMLERLQKDLEG